MKFLTILTVIGITLTSAFSNTWYVDDNAPGPLYDGSQADPFTNILDAVNAAANISGPDTIIVADGTYTGSGVNANFQGNETIIKSANGPTGCIIDGGGTFNGFEFTSALEAGSVVDGFTFTNMSDQLLDAGGSAIRVVGVAIEIKNCRFINNVSASLFNIGGGAVSLTNSGTEILNCQFNGNTSLGGFGNGGAVFSQNGLTRIQTCTFTGNSAVVGGAIYSDGSGIIIEKCFMIGNTAQNGGGIYIASIASFGALIARSMAFVGNTSTNLTGGGGAVYVDNGMATIVNCTLASNSALGAGGAVYSVGSAGSSFANSILRWNGASSGIGGTPGDFTFEFCHVEDFSNTGTNSGDNPMLTRQPFTLGPNDYGDLRLLDGSPCIDSGDDALYMNFLFEVPTDLDGVYNRPLGAAVDRGAYEKVDAITLITVIKNRVDEIAQSTALPADGHPLKQKLDQAAAAVLAGNVTLAIQRLNEFIVKVNQMVPKKLSPTQGSELVGMAQDVIALLQP